MPQLDPTWYVSQMFWLFVCFFVMLFIMSKFILPRITDIMDKRQGKIDDYLEKARENKVLAEESLVNYNKAIAEATAQAQTALEAMQKDLDELVAKRQEELNLRLSKQIADSEAKISKSKEAALTQLDAMSEELAWDVLKKIGIDNVSRKDIKNAVTATAEN